MVAILHVGLGPLGRRTLEDFQKRRMGRIVAAVDSAPDVAGLALAGLVPGADGSVHVLAALDEVPEWEKPDAALVTTSSDLEACMDTFRSLLARGVDVVSSCEELLFPWLRHPVLAQELHERAVRCGARIVGTGVNPGFVMDALPLLVTAVCNDVRTVKVWRIQDASTRRLPFQEKIGAGLDARAFEDAARAGTLRHVGLGESLHFLAHYLGLELDDWEESLEPVLAERDLECGLGPIGKGHAAGVRQVARGLFGGECLIQLEFQAAIGQQDPHDRVLVAGEPPLDLVLRGGVHGDTATSAMLLNCVAALRDAEPGLHTMATLRPAHWRRSP